MELVNDVHSRLNPTRVASVQRPGTTEELARIVKQAALAGRGLTVAGGRHAMGGQAFREGGLLVDARGLDRILDVDQERQIVRAQAGVDWRTLIDELGRRAPELAIVQKPTGADDMTLGGSVASNVHGRGLSLGPLVDQLAALELLDADGVLHRCSAEDERFRLAVGGYGQAGIVTEVALRLQRKLRVRRGVSVRAAPGIVEALESARDEGALFGDFQMAIEPTADALFRRGVLSTYAPVSSRVPLDQPRRLDARAWRRLLELAHTQPGRAFAEYAAYYTQTHGQVYESDRAQLATYLPDYHLELDRRCAARCPGSEMITELYVPRARCELFLGDLRAALIGAGAQPIYATLRLIERDATTALAWAREPWACLVVNLHVDHDEAGRADAIGRFRALIDVALGHGGSFYLTYHRWATSGQLRAAHPGLVGFLRRTGELDPERRFESDWSASLRERLAPNGCVDART